MELRMLKAPNCLIDIFPNEPSLARAALAAIRAEMNSVHSVTADLADTLALASEPVSLYVDAQLAPHSIEALQQALYQHVANAHVVAQKFQVLNAPNPNGSEFASNAPSQFVLRPLQQEMLAAIGFGMEQGKITLVEGSTGIGKTHVICAAAAAAARLKKRVIIAVPTIAVLAQFAKTWEPLKDEFVLSPLIGRGQFVDPTLVRALAEELINTKKSASAHAALIWLDQGGPASTDVLTLPYLRESLDKAAIGFPSELCAHGADINAANEIEKTYQAMRIAAIAAPVVITTHAMLATSMRLSVLRGGESIIGDIDALFIDEAHLFEECVSKAFSNELSLFRLKINLREFTDKQLKEAQAGAAVSRMTGVIEAAMTKLTALAKKGARSQLVAPADDHSYAVISNLLEALLKDKNKLKKLNSRMMESIELLKNRHANRTSPTLISYSPIRKYPSITIGPRGIGKVMKLFWESIPQVALVSATLYVPTQTGWSSKWFQACLGIPTERVYAPKRFFEPWVYAGAHLHLPTKAAAHRLTPDSEHIQRGPYLHALANQISAICRRPDEGGTLILFTRFDDIVEIQKRIGDDLGDRLITQSSGTFARCAERFSRQNNNPVWLATGAAWYGLNLVSPGAAADDRSIVNLIIVRLPFGLDSTPLQYERRQRMGINVARIEAAIRLRQGCGRAVRREGSPTRHIWILDGRIQNNSYVVGSCVKILAEYSNQSEFE